ncbi:efflux RND transporter periplasmic adaptor subunit [Desulfobacula sp.]|uniref:efflux RND transporter periplasmic adaptor subunit n=1 Tax=Desulfobacula sp. TaxID=2593537 RepID=UPI002623872B|nr:efflux RND transporter periplasmic adaptor subunit [Desulfobacula sp.]
MKKQRPFFILLVVIIAAVLAWFLFVEEEDHSNTLRVSGNIEITDAQLGFKIPGRLDACFVDEGDTVAKGALLARLENSDQKIVVALGETRLARARSVLSELVAGSRPEEIQLAGAKVLQARQTVLELTRGSRVQEIESAGSDLDTAMAAEKSAQTQLIQARADYDRFSILYQQKNISQRDFELYQTRYEVAQNTVQELRSKVNIARQALSLRREGPRSEQIEKAKAALSQAQAEYSLVKAGPRKEKIEQARAQVKEAEQTLNQALQQLSYTELYAPMAGIILTRSAEPGEYLNPSTPVVTLGDLHHPWLRAFINETDLGKIRLGDRVTVTTDSFPDTSYDGILSFISSQAEFTPKSVQTFEERVKLMFRIKIDLSNPHQSLKPGMPADAVLSISSP